MRDQKGEEAVMIDLKLASFAFFGAFIVTLSAQAGDQPQQGRYVNLKPTELNCTKLDDGEGHIICSFEIPGVTVLADGTLVSRLAHGTLNYINWEGTAEGYVIETYADGSTHTSKWSGTSKITDEKVRVIEGPYECVAGSGRFAGIECKGTWAQTAQKAGFHTGEYEGTMTLPD
jgi:hypothetical protein